MSKTFEQPPIEALKLTKKKKGAPFKNFEWIEIKDAIVFINEFGAMVMNSKSTWEIGLRSSARLFDTVKAITTREQNTIKESITLDRVIAYTFEYAKLSGIKPPISDEDWIKLTNKSLDLIKTSSNLYCNHGEFTSRAEKYYVVSVSYFSKKTKFKNTDTLLELIEEMVFRKNNPKELNASRDLFLRGYISVNVLIKFKEALDARVLERVTRHVLTPAHAYPLDQGH